MKSPIKSKMSHNKTTEKFHLKGNKLIAEFLGWKFVKDDNDIITGWYKEVKMWILSIKEFDNLLLRGFCYHTSWEKLMEIVEGIEKKDYGFKMCRKVVEVYIDSSKEILLKVKESSRRESLYRAIIDFIPWYNMKSNEVV